MMKLMLHVYICYDYKFIKLKYCTRTSFNVFNDVSTLLDILDNVINSRVCAFLCIHVDLIKQLG